MLDTAATPRPAAATEEGITVDATRSLHPHQHRRPRRMPALMGSLAVVVMLLIAALLASPAAANYPGFPDVPSTHPYYSAITDLASRGVINGYGSGNFGPGDPVARQQFAKMIVRAIGYPVSTTDLCPFGDVPPGTDPTEPMYPDHYIAVAAAQGITEGTSPGVFSPYRRITRYQVVTMVVRTIDSLQPGLLAAPPASFAGTSGWADSSTHSPSALRAEYNHLLDGLPLGTLDPWGDMTRGEVAQVLHRVLRRITSTPVVVSTAPGTIEVLQRSTDNSLRFTSVNAGVWSQGLSIGRPVASDPSVIAWGSGRLDVFVRWADNTLRHNTYFMGTWSGWENLGGSVASAPSAVRWGPGRMDVFVRGTDNTLQHIAHDGNAWSGWEYLQGSIAGDPSAVSWAPGRLDVFVRGGNNALWTRSWDKNNGSTWSNWQSLLGILLGSPKAVSRDLGRLDVVARAGDSSMWRISFAAGAWSEWEDLEGSLVLDPAVVIAGPARLDIFARGSNGELWHRAHNGLVWSAWESLGGALTSGPGAVSWQPGRMDVFSSQVGGLLGQRSWQGFWLP